MPDPIYSEQTLAERALRKLQVLAAGQPANADETIIVTDKIEGVLLDLTSRRIGAFSDAVSILPAQFDYVAACLAERCTAEFGVSGEALSKVRADKDMAEMKLQELTYRVRKPNKLRVDPVLTYRRLHQW